MRWDEESHRWDVGPIDWEPLRRTLAQGGPDSSRRIGEAADNWSRTAWVRAALSDNLSDNNVAANGAGAGSTSASES